jgi:hypothetical protein
MSTGGRRRRDVRSGQVRPGRDESFVGLDRQRVLKVKAKYDRVIFCMTRHIPHLYCNIIRSRWEALHCRTRAKARESP